MRGCPRRGTSRWSPHGASPATCRRCRPSRCMSIRQRRNRRHCGPHRYERGGLSGAGRGLADRSAQVAVGPAHADALAAIHAAAFRGQEVWAASVLAGQLALPGTFALLDPVGGMVVARVIGDEAEILTLAVVPEARRGGIARRLLAGAMQRAAAAGATEMFLEVAA